MSMSSHPSRRGLGSSLTRRRRATIFSALGLVAVTALTGCSTAESADLTGSADRTKVATAKERYEAARNAPKFEAPGPGFDASKATGMTVYNIANTLSLPFTKDLSDATTAGLAKAGVKNVVVDNKADVSETARLIQQAISQKADAIIVQSQQAKLIAAPLRAAKQAGIPVVVLFETDPRFPPQESKDLGVVAEASFCYSCGGRLLVDYALADSGGSFNAATYWDSDVGVSTSLNDGMKAELKELCPEACKVTFKDVLVSQWAAQIPTMTAGDMKAQPPYDYLLPNYDAMITLMAPAIAAAGATDRVKVASFNADPPIMEMLKKGDTVSSLVGSPVEWMGWGIADQVLRVLTGTAVVEDEKVPLRVFDRENIGGIDPKGSESDWYETDFKSGYLALWGIS
jgi:ribose transport system substrate-binding protein